MLHHLCGSRKVFDAGLCRRLLKTNLSWRVHETNNWGWTPLFSAAVTANLKAVNLLIRCGANPWHVDYEDRTALHAVAQCGHEHCVCLQELCDGQEERRYWQNVKATVRLLVDEGVDIDAVEANGLTAHDLATISGYDKMQKLLQEASEK